MLHDIGIDAKHDAPRLVDAVVRLRAVRVPPQLRQAALECTIDNNDSCDTNAT